MTAAIARGARLGRRAGPGHSGRARRTVSDAGAGPTFKTGTGRIRGRVLATDVPARQSGARRCASRARDRGEDGADRRRGPLRVPRLPAGRFNAAGHRSPASSACSTARRGRSSPASRSSWPTSRALDNADISMPRGSVIAGRIVDEFGDPIPDVSVTAMRQTWQNGRRRLAPSPGRVAQTNDLGQFRIYGLPPGDYYVSATLRGRAGHDGGRDGGERSSADSTRQGPTASDAEVRLCPDLLSPARRTSPRRSASRSPPARRSPSADFALVAGASGEDYRHRDRLRRQAARGRDGDRRRQANRDFDGHARHAELRAGRKDGSFTLSNVPPGDYTLQADRVQVITSSQGDNMMVFRADPGGGGGGDAESGSTPLAVAGEDRPGHRADDEQGRNGNGPGHVRRRRRTAERDSRSASRRRRPIQRWPWIRRRPGPGAVRTTARSSSKGWPGQRLIRTAALRRAGR